MIIRKATKEDFKSIQYLSIQLGYNYPPSKVRGKIKEILSKEDHILLVATNGESNKTIGYAHAQIYDVLFSDTLLNLLGIVVDELYRGSGVGTALLKELEERAIMKGCHGLRACSGSNRKMAHNFYRNNEYNEEKRQIRFIKQFSGLGRK